MLYIILALILLFIVVNVIRKRLFVHLFDLGNVIVSGMRGRGKDMAFCVVVNTRKRDYISNVQYSDPKKRYKCFPLDLNVWKIGGNTYTDLVSGEVKPYSYPYPDGIDYYISDGGIYFPAQFATQLAQKYKSETMFQALSRHLGNASVFINVQQQSRIWDKIREQSDIFIVMKKCYVPKLPFFRKFCCLTAYSYDIAESAEKQIVPPRFGFGKIAKDNKFKFEIAHGKIRKYKFWTRIPYCYDDRRFKKILESGLNWEDTI